jgi:hypothetical protein
MAAMAAKPLDIGDLNFARKGDAAEHFRRILRRHDPGVALSEPDATHVYWLLERHPEAAAKIGAGVKEFTTRKAMFDTRCFEIRRIDGTTTDFSVKPCLDGKAPSAFAETLRGMRTEVVEDIKQMKWEFFRASTHPDGKAPCALSGRLLSLEEAMINHASPKTFKALAERFPEENRIVPGEALLTPAMDNQYTPRLADRDLAEKWWGFSRANSAPRIVAR